MKRSTKYTIKKGKVVLNKPAKPKAKLTAYERYVNIAHDNGVPESEIFTKEEYNTIVVSNKERNLPAKPDAIVRQQLHDDLTDREFRARLNAARRIDSTMTRKKFIQTQGWEFIDDYAAQRYAELKATYGSSLSTAVLAPMISTEIYGSE